MLLNLLFGTLTYFSAQKNAQGTLTLGELDFCIDESGGDSLNLLPGQTIDKSINIINSRNLKGTDTNGLCSIYFRYSILVYVNNKIEDMSTKLINNCPNYVLDNGKYYYTKALEPSQSTYLTKNLALSNLLGNEYQNCSIQIIYSIEAIQAQNQAYAELWTDAPGEWVNIIEN